MLDVSERRVCRVLGQHRSATYLDAKYRDFFTDNGRTNLTGNLVQRHARATSGT